MTDKEAGKLASPDQVGMDLDQERFDSKPVPQKALIKAILHAWKKRQASADSTAKKRPHP